MQDSKQQLKALGLRFARALEMTVKTAVMFTVEHQSVQRPVLQSFQFLNSLLKETGHFTFGFVDNQVMLNNVLTSDTTLRHLETEFLKRGIAAVTFEPGLTLGRYKKIVSLLSARTAAIDATGGLLSFLDQNEVEGARILPAAKNQKKDEHGDTIIETDSEAYILSKQMGDEDAPRDLLDSIDALLESACFDPASRADVLSNLAAQGLDASAYGVPVGIPNLVIVKEGETVVPTSGDPGGTVGAPSQGQPSGHGVHGTTADSTAGTGNTGHFPGNGNGSGSGFSQSGFSQFGSGTYSGDGSGVFGGMPTAGGAGFGKGGGAWSSGQGSFIHLVEPSVHRSLLDYQTNPHPPSPSLSPVLPNIRVDTI